MTMNKTELARELSDTEFYRITELEDMIFTDSYIYADGFKIRDVVEAIGEDEFKLYTEIEDFDEEFECHEDAEAYLDDYLAECERETCEMIDDYWASR